MLTATAAAFIPRAGSLAVGDGGGAAGTWAPAGPARAPHTIPDATVSAISLILARMAGL
jgi:hypothetical protein